MRLTLHLPTEARWERLPVANMAMSGRGGINSMKTGAIRAEGKKPKGLYYAGRRYPQGESPYGVADLAGNVWEWTHTLFKAYHTQVKDGRENEKDSHARVLPGGSFFSDPGTFVVVSPQPRPRNS